MATVTADARRCSNCSREQEMYDGPCRGAVSWNPSEILIAKPPSCKKECTFFRGLRWYKKTVIMALRFFDDFVCDFSIFTKRQDPLEITQFTIGFPIVNSLDFVGSLRIYENRKISEKSSKNLRAMIIVFLYHPKHLKNVHSFLQLEVLKIKISHRFGLAPGNSYFSGRGRGGGREWRGLCDQQNTVVNFQTKCSIFEPPICRRKSSAWLWRSRPNYSGGG